MIKVHSFLSKILLMSFLLASLVFTACSNVSGGSGSAGELNNGSNDTEKHGYKVTVNWLIPGETETIEEIHISTETNTVLGKAHIKRDMWSL